MAKSFSVFETSDECFHRVLHRFPSTCAVETFSGDGVSIYHNILGISIETRALTSIKLNLWDLNA